MAALLLLILGAANAAGLGNLVASSSLGEPFRAEIDLMAYGDEWASLTPRMAPPDAYQLAGYRYNPALAGARLITRKHPNGRGYIELTSSRPVNEPFLYLLIQLDSNATRIMRGYTVLIDPPGFGPPVVSAPIMVPALRSAAVAPGTARGRATADASVAARIQKEAARPLPRDPLKDITAAAGSTPNLSGRIQLLEDKVNSTAKTLAGLMERVAAMEETVRRLQQGLEMQKSAAAAAKSKVEAVAGPKPQKAPAEPAKEASQAVAPPAPPVVPAAEAPPVRSPVVAKPEVVAPAEPQKAVAEPVKEAPPAAAPPAPPPVAQAAPETATSTEVSPPRPAPGRPNSMVSEALLVLAGGSLILVGWLVYLLWRRPRQGVTSEDILTKLLARDPQRDDVQLKLLEIYAARGDKTAYQNMAGKFHQLTGGEGDAWLKVASTGYELDPGNPLYVAGKYAAIVASVTGDANHVRH